MDQVTVIRPVKELITRCFVGRTSMYFSCAPKIALKSHMKHQSSGISVMHYVKFQPNLPSEMGITHQGHDIIYKIPINSRYGVV